MLPRLIVVAVTPTSLAVLGLPFVVPEPWVLWPLPEGPLPPLPDPPGPAAVPPGPVTELPPGPLTAPPPEPGAPGAAEPLTVPGPRPPFCAPVPTAAKSLSGRLLPQAASTRQTPIVSSMAR